MTDSESALPAVVSVESEHIAKCPEGVEPEEQHKVAEYGTTQPSQLTLAFRSQRRSKSRLRMKILYWRGMSATPS